MIYLLRHGETVWNAIGRYQGHKNSPLTARGRAQAAALGRILARETSSAVGPLRAYVSPLGRARETAEIVGQHVPLDRVDDPRLREVTLGSWDGMRYEEVKTKYFELLEGATDFDWFFRSPDGERFNAVSNRISAWLRYVQMPCAVISHGLTGQIVRGVYLGLSMRETLELPITQEGIYELHEGHVRLINETNLPVR